MPIIAGHEQWLPAGQQLSRLMRQLLRRQGDAVLSRLKATGYAFAPSLHDWNAQMIAAITPLLLYHAKDGGLRASRRINAHLSTPRPQPVGPIKVFAGGLFLGTGEMVVKAAWGKQMVQAWKRFGGRLLSLATDLAKRFVEELNQTSQRLVQKAMREAWDARTIRVDFPEMIKGLLHTVFNSPARAKGIGGTEASKAFHAGQYLLAQESGVVRSMRWKCSAGACEACLALERVGPVPLGTPFAVISGRLHHADEVVLYPPLHPT